MPSNSSFLLLHGTTRNCNSEAALLCLALAWAFVFCFLAEKLHDIIPVNRKIRILKTPGTRLENNWFGSQQSDIWQSEFHFISFCSFFGSSSSRFVLFRSQGWQAVRCPQSPQSPQCPYQEAASGSLCVFSSQTISSSFLSLQDCSQHSRPPLDTIGWSPSPGWHWLCENSLFEGSFQVKSGGSHWMRKVLI